LRHVAFYVFSAVVIQDVEFEEGRKGDVLFDLLCGVGAKRHQHSCGAELLKPSDIWDIFSLVSGSKGGKNIKFFDHGNLLGACTVSCVIGQKIDDQVTKEAGGRVL
jgi:hypothetical protein